MNHLPLPKWFLSPEYSFRFWSHAIILSVEECWNWTGALTTGNKYGIKQPKVNYKNTIYLANRVSYFIYSRTDPGEFFVCHHCDNVLCVNPHCLFLGSAQDNSDDCVIKGRQTKGTKNGRALINAEIAQSIRELHATGKYSHRDLVRQFQLSKGEIYNILHKITWKT